MHNRSSPLRSERRNLTRNAPVVTHRVVTPHTAQYLSCKNRRALQWYGISGLLFLELAVTRVYTPTPSALLTRPLGLPSDRTTNDRATVHGRRYAHTHTYTALHGLELIKRNKGKTATTVGGGSGSTKYLPPHLREGSKRVCECV